MGSSMSGLSDISRETLHERANKFVFHPRLAKGIKYPNTLNQFNIPSTNGNTIEVLSCNPKTGKCFTRKLLIFLHGNACINEDMYQFLQIMSDTFSVKVVGFDYQGYGNSQGKCSEQNCYDDITNVVNYFIKDQQYKSNEIYLMGQSLGTGIVVDYVSKNDWKTPVILISPYESMLRVVVDESSAYISSSVDMFKTRSKLDSIKCPVKIFHGRNDELIPISHAENLYKELPNKTLQPSWIDNCGHNDILQKMSMNEVAFVLYDAKI